jgi:hypothetical protein
VAWFTVRQLNHSHTREPRVIQPVCKLEHTVFLYLSPTWKDIGHIISKIWVLPSAQLIMKSRAFVELEGLQIKMEVLPSHKQMFLLISLQNVSAQIGHHEVIF